MPWEQYAAQKPWELYGTPAPESIDQEDQTLAPPGTDAVPKPADVPFAPGWRKKFGTDDQSETDAAKNFNLGREFETAGAAALNLPARAYRAIEGTPKTAVTTFDAQGNPQISEAGKPLPFTAGQSPYQPKGTLENPEGNNAQKMIQGALTPGVIASFPFGGTKAVQQIFLSQTIPGVLESLKKLVAPGKTLRERQDAATDLVVNAIISHGLAKEVGKGGGDYASSISTPTEVHGDVQPQPGGGQGEVPAQEGGGGVQPQAQGAVQTEVPLKPKGQDQFGYKYTKDADGNWYQDGVGKKVTDERLLNKLEEDHEQMRPKADWQVSVQAPIDLGGGKVAPGNVQLVDPSDAGHTGTGGNKVVATVASVRAAGHNVPDFSQLPQGKYTYAEALKKLKESPGTGLPKEDTKNAAGAEVRTQPQSGVHLQHDEETGEWHVVNGKDEVVSSHATMDEAAKAAAPEGGKEPEPEPFLEPTDQKAFDYEIKKVGLPIKYTDELDPNNPFHAHGDTTLASIDRASGSILINKENLKAWLDTLPKERRSTAIKSMLAEEQIHLHTDDAAATTYWKNLSPWEQAIAKRRYSGGHDVPGMNDTMWGHEALRFRIQQLARMTPTEVASAVGKEKWTLKGLSVAEHAIRGARSVLNFKKSRESTAILNKIQENLAAARAAVTGSAPRALFRGRPKKTTAPKEQQDFELPGMASTRLAGSKIAASNVPGQEGAELPKATAEEKAAGEAKVASAVPQRPTAAELGTIGEEALRNDIVARVEQAKTGQNTRLPDLKDFTAELKKRWSNLKPGEISDLWSGTVGKMIQELPGEAMRLMGKAAFGGNVREILSDKEINEKFPGDAKAATEYAKQQEKALTREGKKKGGSIWNAPVPDADEGADIKVKYTALERDLEKKMGELEERKAEVKELKDEVDNYSEGDLKLPELEERLKDARTDVWDATKFAQDARRRIKELEPDYQSVIQKQKRRAWISSAIFRKMVKPQEADSEHILNRKEITPDDVRPSNDGKYSSYEDVSDFPESRMGEALVDKARRSSKDSATITRRLALVENKRTGEVSLVSAYDRPHGPEVENDPYLVDPLSPTRTGMPLADFKGKYNILRSVFLDQPVRKFVQHFKDYDEYRDKLGKQLEMDVANAAGHSPEAISESEFAQEAGGRISEGSGGSFQGPHRDLVSEPESGAAEKSEVTPITPHEERSLVDYVNQFGRPRNPEDVMRAIQEMAVKKPNAAVVSALRKISAGFQKHFPDYDTEATLKALARAIYDKTIPTGRALPEAEGATAAGPGEDAGTAAQTTGEPPGNKTQPAVRRPSPGEDVKSPRAIFRKRLNDHKDETLVKLGVAKNQVKMLYKRKSTAAHMASSIDGLETIGNNMGAQAEMSIRLESADNDKNSLGFAKNFRGKKDILESAPAVLASGAVKTLYHYDTKALAEKARLFKEDEYFLKRALDLKSMLGRASKDEIARVQKEVGTHMQNRLIETGFLKHDNARYLIDHSAKDKLDFFMEQVKQGTEAANRMVKGGNVWDRFRGRAWLKSNEKIMRSLEYAKAQWDHPELMNTARRAKMESDRQFDIERDNGYSLHYDPEYLPGRYDGSVWSPSGIIFGGKRVMGKQFRQGKTFKNIYEAASVGPYIPASLDVASLMGSRVRTGMHSVARRMWWDSLKSLKDENGNFVVKEGKKGGGPPSPDYVEFPLKGTGDKVYVHQAYEGLVHQLTDPSAVHHNAASKLLLESTQFLKHTALLGDVFHLGRVMYYSQSIMGFKGARFKPGWAATVIREGDLDRAVDRGIIAPKTRDYLKEKVAFRMGTKADMISRSRLSELYEKAGLNTGRIQDAIYKDLVKSFPGLGTYNRFLFDRFTTGMMKSAALKEFDRLSKLDPEKDSRQIIQESAKDLNLYFGSIGRQGWIRSATIRDVFNIGLLAPQWLEGLIKKEVQPLKLLTNPHAALTGRTTAFRGIARGLGAMILLTQVMNMITRGKPTWQNEEKDHKWEAWLPGNVWLSPLAVFNELTADILRIQETKPRLWDAIQQVGMNKLSFAGRFATVLASGKSPTGEYQSSTGGVLRNAAEQLIPIPISIGTWAQFGAHFLAPGTIPPVPLPQLMQKTFATMGIKTHVGLDPVQTMHIAAQAFKQANGVEEPKIDFTDEATNSKLRYQLKSGDVGGATRTLNELRKHHSDGEIIQAMETWARRPFTSQVQEGMFRAGMDDYGRKVYDQAVQQRYDQVNQFLDFYNQAGQGSGK